MTEHQLAPENDEQTIFVEGLTDWEFIDNRRCSVADWIRSHLPSSTSASICVAYLSPSGFRIIEDELEHFLNKGASLSIISSEEISIVIVINQIEIIILIFPSSRATFE